MSKETRCYQASEVRAMGGSSDADPLRIEGYAATFNSYSQDLGGFKERIQPGAFTRTIEQNQDVRCLFNHDPNVVLGRTTSKTLRLSQDARGLKFTCDLPNTQQARDLHTSIERGDINQCSFSFQVDKAGQEWTEEKDENGVYFASRTLINVDTYDVSPVTYPAYQSTSVAVRSDLIPVEIRSAIDAKNKPEVREDVMDICDIHKLPGEWTPEVKAAYCKAFDEAYAKARVEGKKGHVACSEAHSAAVQAIVDELPAENKTGTPASDNCEYVETFRSANGLTFTDKRSADDLSDVDAEFDEEDIEDRGVVPEEELKAAGHCADGDCEVRDCPCQNRFAFHKRASDDTFELRSGSTRTKHVAGKDYPASAFAYVGDKDDTSTWKFPVFDADHARNALARWGQAKGIPAASKAGVYAKIVAAAKKFGVEVADDSRTLTREESLEMIERFAKLGVVEYVNYKSEERYSDDQPRDYHGRFGQTSGESAHTVQGHDQAREEHIAKALAHQKAGEDKPALAHLAAAGAHEKAADAFAKSTTDTKDKMASLVAQSASKDAHAASKKEGEEWVKSGPTVMGTNEHGQKVSMSTFSKKKDLERSDLTDAEKRVETTVVEEERGTPDQPRADAGKFGAGKGHKAQAQAHLDAAKTESKAGNKDAALKHHEAAAAHLKAGDEPSTENTKEANEASDKAAAASALANAHNRK